MREGRAIPEQFTHNMMETGRTRALSGKYPLIGVVRELYKKTPERATEYLYGYMSVVQETLVNSGISDPQQLGINESFAHVVIQDPRNVEITGIEGLVDGMKVVEPSNKYGRIGSSTHTHYADGYKIGFAFTREHVKSGRFEALTHEKSMSPMEKGVITDDIRQWIADNKIKGVTAEVILHLNPYARTGFSSFHNNESLEHFLDRITHQQATNSELTKAEKEINIEAAKKGYNFAQHRQEASKITTPTFR